MSLPQNHGRSARDKQSSLFVQCVSYKEKKCCNIAPRLVERFEILTEYQLTQTVSAKAVKVTQNTPGEPVL